MAARQRTDAGAEAFIRYFFDQFNVAWTEPRPGLIESLSDPSCQFCKRSESAARDLKTHGERYATDPVSIEAVSLFGGAPESQQFAEITHVQNAADVVDGHGKKVASDPRDENQFYVTLKWNSNKWVLLEMERTS